MNDTVSWVIREILISGFERAFLSRDSTDTLEVAVIHEIKEGAVARVVGI
jgi:hypothetical protein